VPNQSTGQVVYMKMAKGVFFATRSQYNLFHSVLACGFLSFAAIVLLNVLKFKGNDRDFVSDKPPTAIGYFAGFIITCVLIIVLFFGDHLMQFIFSGSLTLPPENRRMIPHQLIPPEYRS
jgi:hypothetical protein